MKPLESGHSRAAIPILVQKGRGAVSHMQGRFEEHGRELFDDGWVGDEEAPGALRTRVQHEIAKSILTRNNSPDIPFDVSLNPYRGCEHGCIYCYARPSHSFLGLSPGLDFESRLFAKVNAAELLKRELARPGYQVKPIAIGVNTDAYQPIERELRITRAVLEVLSQAQHPCTLITKSSLIERDIDLLAEMARKNLVRVAITITTLDHELARKLEPRAVSPTRRMRSISVLADAGIPVSVCVSPIIPFINDGDLESVLESGAAAGATGAHYIVLRLPLEIDELFQQWLAVHYPDRAERVMNRIRDMRGGRNNDSRFGVRMRGAGLWAELYRQRFAKRTRRLALNGQRDPLALDLFTAPIVLETSQPQLDLFNA